VRHPPSVVRLIVLDGVSERGKLVRRLLEERVQQLPDESPALRTATERRGQPFESLFVDRPVRDAERSLPAGKARA
jgi:hypothetical protein